MKRLCSPMSTYFSVFAAENTLWPSHPRCVLLTLSEGCWVDRWWTASWLLWAQLTPHFYLRVVLLFSAHTVCVWDIFIHHCHCETILYCDFKLFEEREKHCVDLNVEILKISVLADLVTPVVTMVTASVFYTTANFSLSSYFVRKSRSISNSDLISCCTRCN